MTAPLAARYGSPRTAEEPMAFTAGEFIRGAAFAWIAFNGLAPVVITIVSLIGALASPARAGLGFVPVMFMLAPGYLIPWSLGALLIAGAPLAWLLGRALRRVSRRPVHIAAFAMLGAVVGAATTIVFSVAVSLGLLGRGLLVGDSPLEWWPSLIQFGGATAVAVVIGWWITATFALRADERTVTDADHMVVDVDVDVDVP